MKILFLVPIPPPYGGIANWFSQVSKSLDADDNVEYSVIDIFPGNDAIAATSILQRIKKGLALFSLIQSVKRELKTNKYDVIHITTSGSLAVIRDYFITRAIRNTGVPVIYHIHCGRFPGYLKRGGWRANLIKEVVSMSAVTIAIEKNTYRSVSKAVVGANVKMVPNMIDLDQLPEPKTIKKKYVSYVGWLIKEKGIEELIEAWNIVGEKYKDYTLMLVGPIKEDFSSTIKSLIETDNVKVPGEVTHESALEIINDSQLFVLPSYTEGLPNVILEAMSLKTPIIATDVGAMPEMLSNGGGIIIKTKPTDDIQKALLQILSQPEYGKRCSEIAYEKVKSEYDSNAVMKQLYAIWGNIRSF